MGRTVRYEIIREIFNECSKNQMRDVSVEERDVEDIDAYMDQFRTGKDLVEERSVAKDGAIVYDIVADGLKQRISFTEA